MKTFDTLSQAVEALQKDGYTANLSLLTGCLHCSEMDLNLSPHEFQIDAFYRFEGQNDPGDSNILYAISSANHQIKGLLVSAYGVYEDGISNELVEKLNVHPN